MNQAQKNSSWLPYSLDSSVGEVFPNIIERPFLFVYSDIKLIELAIYFGVGPQIYVDGLLVFQQRSEIEQEGEDRLSREMGIRSQKVIGRVASKHIIPRLLQTDFSSYNIRYLYTTTASEIMDPITKYQKVKIDSPIRGVIDVFRETKFAFVPIMDIRSSSKGYSNHDGKVEDERKIAGVLSIKDFLPLFSGLSSNSTNNTNTTNITETLKMAPITAKDISSDLVSVNKNASIKEAVDIMVNRQIRNLGIEDDDSNLIGLINDRTILEFLFRDMREKDSGGSSVDPDNSINININNNNIQHTYYKGDVIDESSINSVGNPVLNMSIMNNLKIVPLSKLVVIDNDTTISQASELLMDVHYPCLIMRSNHAIVTPWDIVMKTI